MNPVYTGKDVSFIDTKQAQRSAENTLLSAEKFATIAGLLGARFPSEAIDKAWRQLLFGAHHDGITGSESDQVYLDLLGGWREAQEHGQAALDGALNHLGSRIDTTGDGTALNVRALSQRCPHLGCRPNPCLEDFWLRCPCHQSRYDRLGIKVAGERYGPAPRGMDRYSVRVDKEGVLFVDTSRITLGPLPVELGQPGLIPPLVENGCV